MSAPQPLYVSCNPEEGPVARYGMRNVLIGAQRDSRQPKKIEYRPEEVVVIPADEAVRFQQEYGAAIASKALIVRSKADHAAWLEAEEAHYAKIAADAKAAREAAAKAAQAETQAPQDAPTESESAQ